MNDERVLKKPKQEDKMSKLVRISKAITAFLATGALAASGFKYVIEANDTAIRAEQKADKALVEKANKEDLKDLNQEVKELQKKLDRYIRYEEQNDVTIWHLKRPSGRKTR